MQYRYDTLQALGRASQTLGESRTQGHFTEEPTETAPFSRGSDDYLDLGEEPSSLPQNAAPDDDGAPAAARQELPWTGGGRRGESPLLRLHNDLVSLSAFLAPRQGEREAREAAIQRLTGVVHSIWPAARVEVFGSFVTGLYLPTSDLDVVVLDSREADLRAALRAVATGLLRKDLARNVQIIGKAKVPIIKYEDAQAGLNIDVSFDAANGPQAAEYVRRLMARLPPMRPLTLVLKLFLHQRELNEVYQGGIGSYALLVMVAAFLLGHPSRGSGAGLEPSLGVLLLDFLRLYGRALNADHAAVSCRGKGGAFFGRADRALPQQERAGALAVEDPTEPSNDLSRASYNAHKVRAAFDFAYQLLTAPAVPGESLLARVVRLDAQLMEREAPPGLPEEREQGREKVYSKRKTAQSSGDSEQRQSGTQPQKRRRKPTAERSLPREESAAALPRKVVPPIEGAKIPPDPASPQRHAAGPKGPAMRLKSNPSLTGTLGHSRTSKRETKLRERDMAFQ